MEEPIERERGGGFPDFKSIISQNRRLVDRIVWGTALVLYIVYLGFAIAHHVRNKIEIDYCGGLGFLLIITGLVVLGYAYAGMRMLAVKTGFSKTLSSTAESVSQVLSNR